MEKLIPTLVSTGISFCLAIAGWIIKNTIYKRIDTNEEEVSKLKEKVNKIDKDSIRHEDLSKLEDKVSQIDKDSIRHEDLKDIQKDIKDIRDCYIKKDDFIRSIDGIHGDIKNLEKLIMELIKQEEKMNKENDLKALRAMKFKENNGDVLRKINLLRDKHMELKDVEGLMCSSGVSSRDVIDSINFLEVEGYITLRDKNTKTETNLADADISNLEARLTGRGIRLVNGAIIDDLVVI